MGSYSSKGEIWAKRTLFNNQILKNEPVNLLKINWAIPMIKVINLHYKLFNSAM